jgi:hypothetical protein
VAVVTEFHRRYASLKISQCADAFSNLLTGLNQIILATDPQQNRPKVRLNFPLTVFFCLVMMFTVRIKKSKSALTDFVKNIPADQKSEGRRAVAPRPFFWVFLNSGPDSAPKLIGGLYYAA